MAQGTEADRLDEARAGVPWKRWGPVPQRAAVGHGARGLQRQRRRVELLQPRPGAVARLQVGRGRHRRLLRRPPAPVLRDRAVERRRPDPQGADVRPDQRRGQPRRGREGVLLLPRRHADELVPEVPVPVPARRVPVRRPRGDEPAPRAARRWSTSCSTPACSTTTATSTSTSSTPRRRPTTSTSASRSPTAAPSRRRCTCCRRCGSATRGGWASPKGTLRAPADAAGDHRRRASRPRRARAALRRRADAAVHRERDEHRAAVGHAERDAVREGRVPRATSSTGETDAVNPARTGTKAAAHYVVDVPAGGAERRASCACAGPTRRRSTAPSVDARVRRPRIAEADEFYASITPAAVPADEAAVMRQALAGMLWGKQLYFFDLDRWLEEHDVPPAARRSDGPERAQPRAGSTWSTTT